MKNKNKKKKSLLLLFILVLAISIGFAGLATTLKIYGEAAIKKNTWSIHWDNVEVKKGSATAITPAYIKDAKKTIVEYSVVFEKPGDFYEFTVDAVNDGTIDGQISVFSNEVLDENDEVVSPIPSYITSSVTYSDDRPIAQKQLLKVDRSEKYKVRVSYDVSDPNELVASDIEYKFRFSVTYVQADDDGSIRDAICNASIYDNGDVTESRYLDQCDGYYDESIYTWTTNDDDTLTITGFREGYTIQQMSGGARDIKATKLVNNKDVKATQVNNKVISFKDGVWAIPLKIEGKKVTKISGSAFRDKEINAELVLPPTLIEIEDGGYDTKSYGAFSSNNLTAVGLSQNIERIGNNAFYNTRFVSIKIPDKTRVLGSGSFAAVAPLSDVDLGNGVEIISAGTFAGDSNITEIEFPNTVTTIEGGSFGGTKLKKLVLPDSLVTLGYGTFTLDTLEEITTGNGIKTMDFGMFDFTNVKKLVVGNGVESITIGNTPKLTTLVLGDHVKTISSGSFQGALITKIKLPDSLTTLGAGSFCGCYLVKEIDTGNGLTAINNGVFSGSYNGHSITESLEKVIIGNSVTTITDGAFGTTTKLKELVLGNHVETISNGAFYGSGLTKLVLPDSARTVNNGAFAGSKIKYFDTGNGLVVVESSGLTNNPFETVIFGDSVTTISGTGPFSNKSTLTTVKFGKSLQTISDGAFVNSAITSVDLSNTKMTEIAAGVFSNNNISLLKLREGITTIGGGAFQHNNITGVDLPSTVTTVGVNAFGYNDISSVNIPNSVVTIGDSAFQYNNISKVDIPNSVTTIGDYAFTHNNISELNLGNNITYLSGFDHNNISSINIPSTVVEIGHKAFEVNKISSINFPAGLEKIGGLAFGLNNLSTVDIPNSVTTLGDAAFYGNKLTDYTLPLNIQNIGGGVFVGNMITDPDKQFTYVMEDGAYDYSTLSGYNGRGGTVTIPSGVTKLANFAFFNTYITGINGMENITEVGEHVFSWTELDTFTVPASLAELSPSMFYGAKLRNITLTNSITEIPASAFLRTDLESITIPSSVTAIRYNAFRDTKLTTVTIPETVTTIEGNAFAGCNLSTVYFYPNDAWMGFPTFYKGRIRSGEEYDYGNSNPNLTVIHNLGNMKHYWGGIVNGDQSTSGSVTSGTISTELGNVTISTN